MNVAVIAAAGSSARMGGEKKEFLSVLGTPILAHTLLAFEQCPLIEKIIVAVRDSDRKRFEEEILSGYGLKKVLDVVKGGKERQDSVLNGLRSLPRETNAVVVHDGARPLVTPELIVAVVKALEGWDGVVAAVPLRDTVKKVDAQQGIETTVERGGLWAAQTPQVFRPESLMKAHQRARMDGFYGTDDAVLLERLGYRVRVIMGSYQNIKITTPEDLVITEAILKSRSAPAGSGKR